MVGMGDPTYTTHLSYLPIHRAWQWHGSMAEVAARHEAGRRRLAGLGRGALGRARSSDKVVAPAGGAA
jgi:hypothetical protein